MRRALLVSGVSAALLLGASGCSGSSRQNVPEVSAAKDMTPEHMPAGASPSSVEPPAPTWVPAEPVPRSAVPFLSGHEPRPLPLSRCDLVNAPATEPTLPPGHQLRMDEPPASGCVDLLLPVWPETVEPVE